MIYVILGMHKSGTTMVAEILHKSGIPMIGKEDGNPRYDGGIKYERIATSSLNKDILDCRDKYSLDVLPAQSFQLVGKDEQRKMNEIIDLCVHEAGNGDWGFKDPRTCLTYGAWQQCLPEHALIVVYRRPAQVLQHYLKRNHRRYSCIIPFKALRAWTSYNKAICRIIEHATVPVLAVSYEKLMEDDNELKRLEKFLGREVFDARRKGSFKMRAGRSKLLDVANMICSKIGYSPSYFPVLKMLEAYRSQQC